MKPYLVHNLIHDESRTCHIARIFHKGYKEVEYKDIGKEHNHASHSTDYTIGDKVFQRSFRHGRLHDPGNPVDSRLYPLHRIRTDFKRTPEYKQHYNQENREAEELVGHKGIDYTRCLRRLLCRLGKSLGKCACYEAIFFIGDKRCYVIVVALFYKPHLLVAQLKQFFMVGRMAHHVIYLAVVFQHLYGKITRRKMGAYRTVFLDFVFNHLYTRLYLLAEIDMNMADCLGRVPHKRLSRCQTVH